MTKIIKPTHSFCRHLSPDSNHKKYKTSVKWKNLNPVFNEEFVFETKMTDLPKQTLILTIWDKDYGKSNDYLGENYLKVLNFLRKKLRNNL